VEVTNDDGCSGTAETSVTVFELPVVALGEDQSLCPEETAGLDVSCTGCTYIWSDGGTAGTIDAAPGDTYAVTVTNANGCAASDEVIIEALSQPTVSLGDDVEICSGESTVLVAGGQPGDAYVWSTGAVEPTLTVGAAGEYAVTVTNTEGCASSDTVSVTLGEAVTASITASGTQLCPGDTLSLAGSGASSLLWIDTSFMITRINAANVSLAPMATAEYGLIVTNKCFSDTTYLEVSVSVQQAFAGPDTCVAFRRPALLFAAGAETYQWWDETRTTELGTSAELTVTPDSTTWYYVNMTDSLGCQFTDSVQVEILYLEDLDLPAINTITPNGDGFNDVLEFPNLTKFDTYTLTVFNRHGMTVYDSFNYQNDWDGTRNGEPLPEGVYFYILRIGQQELKSSLTIIRE
jgi:gliding motility-associated-like protein